MKRALLSLTVMAGAVAALSVAGPASGQELVRSVIQELNDTRSVKGTAANKSYIDLFAAYLDLSAPPMPIGEDFSHLTIHPGMADWAAVSGWAESNAHMADAIIAAAQKPMLGLPYGETEVEQRFRDADLTVQMGIGGSLRDNRFPYLDAIDVIAAFTTAECYRRFEVGQADEALDLAVAELFVLRQCCDREFLAELSRNVTMLSQALANLRDMFYLYQDKISVERYARIAKKDIPYLRPERDRLFMPEGDRIVSEALIEEAFGPDEQASPDKFRVTFAAIQSKDKPLTRMGAARRWAWIAEVHDSKEASLKRLTTVYDDWWRRWRIQAYDPLLDYDTEFEVTNQIRFAAVIYSMQNIESLFAMRDLLRASVYSTAMVSGLCAYKVTYGEYPIDIDMTYAQFSSKRADLDPFDVHFQPFKYRSIDQRTALDAEGVRLWLEEGDAILYSRGPDREDNRGAEHTLDGLAGDIVFWPPLRALLRAEGHLP